MRNFDALDVNCNGFYRLAVVNLCQVKVNGCFRLDTFARNEGDSGGKAHFKFVFTLDDGTSLSRESQDGSVASTSSLSLLSYSSTSTRIASGESGVVYFIQYLCVCVCE